MGSMVYHNAAWIGGFSDEGRLKGDLIEGQRGNVKSRCVRQII